MRHELNARFWTMIHGSPVKITLRPGQSLEWATGGYTDEGHHEEGNTWEYDDGIVTEGYWTSGLDCDGIYSTGGAYECTWGRLRLGNEPGLYGIDKLDAPAWRGVVWPDWQEAGSYQRDYAAEAAGY